MFCFKSNIDGSWRFKNLKVLFFIILYSLVIPGD